MLRWSAFICLVSAHAAADDADSATRDAARSLGLSGVEAYQAGDYEVASNRLEKAYSLINVPSLGLWSARALAKRQLLVEAANRYFEVAGLQVPQGDAAVQQQAQADARTELEQLRPQIPKLTIRVLGGAAADVTLSIDGHATSSGIIGKPRLVNPGAHRVEAELATTQKSAAVEVALGQEAAVVLDFSPPPKPASAPEKSGSSSTQRTLGWVVVGAGGVGIALGSVMGGLAFSKHSSIEDSGACTDGHCPPDQRAEIDRLNTIRLVSTVGFHRGWRAGGNGRRAVAHGAVERAPPGRDGVGQPAELHGALLMKLKIALSLGLGLQCAVACIVPTFDVDSSAQGGNAQGGTKAQAGSPQGGSPRGGSAGNDSGGSDSAQGGNAPAGGEAGAGGGSIVSGPVRVGVSMFHDSASGDNHASSKLADAKFAKPANLEPGDFMLVFFGCDHSLANLTDTALEAIGWTLQDQHEEQGIDGQGTYLAYRFVDGSEPDPIVFQGINPDGPGNGVQGLLSVYRGVDPTSPINVYEVKTVDTGSDVAKSIETPTPAVKTTVDNCLLVAGLSPDSAIDAPVVSAWPAGFDENQVSVKNLPNPYSFGWANIYSAERHVPNAGDVAASSFTWDLTYDGTNSYGALTFVLGLAPLAK